ncbi:SDR family NAD(P)-dependent oxidoreductase [Roseicitreum antarcticum]|uniref:NAD(P)-dependent dehydrogenase, short-chain alcohol dehydrogenase family n=1 Tax=Roseicitreum antarcticum TaxID=564137 RepID=A0A1H2YXZ0_9RHOB|nr:SDR family oxidoreductase [Roseicitreum antarcticum]SDX09925.1 NAD(P)-dependent dehydrogenase, short-chain alcohol dehydrogenase family [Roseicitreum antarcticum]
MDLTGKTIVVTGASKGIGAATARAMLDAGARVIAHYGSDRAGAEAALDGAFRDRATLIQADFSDMAAVDDFWAQVRATGPVDVLVNNAGIMRQAGGIEDEVADWDRVWTEAVAINLHAPARLLRHAVRGWLDAGRGGAIIGIGSWVTTRGTSSPAAIAYAASKAGIVAATKTVARNYADRGILAYVISPGVVRTRMSEESAAVTGGAAAVTASLPMREWVPPEEIADLAVYLARGRARHLTGSTIDINGAAYIR